MHDVPLQRTLARRPGKISAGRRARKKWKQRDPIKIYRDRLKKFGVSESTIMRIDAEVKREVDEATERCKAAPPPALDILTTDVYADGGFAWRN